MRDEKSLLIYPRDAQKLLGVGTTKFYELVRLPSFPRPKNLQGKRPMFLRSELIEWASNLPNDEDYFNNEGE